MDFQLCVWFSLFLSKDTVVAKLQEITCKSTSGYLRVMNRDHPGAGMIHVMGDTQAAIFLLLAVGVEKHPKIQPIPRAVLKFLFKKSGPINFTRSIL